MKNLIITLFITIFGFMFSGCHDASTGIVVVGMGNSAKFGKCAGASLDAWNMGNILSAYGSPTVLTDRDATKVNVVNALNKAKNNDLMIFFYSGHGGSSATSDLKDEPDGRNEYLCLYDQLMLDNEIWQIVSSAKGRVMLIFDCCHSETMFRNPCIDFSKILEDEPIERGKVNMLCWSGCPDNEYSYGDNSGGELTLAIMRAYSKKRTYDEVWKSVISQVDCQTPRKTQIGRGFSGKVFN